MSENEKGLSSGTSAPEREARSGRVFVAMLRSDQVGDQSIVVRNLSPHGISARLRSGLLHPGERVTILLNGEPVEAEVRWVRKGHFGARLCREIDPSRFNFAGKSWEGAVEPLGPDHVFDQFKPVSDGRRPGLKVR